jgi:hypothetical protein
MSASEAEIYGIWIEECRGNEEVSETIGLACTVLYCTLSREMYVLDLFGCM